MTTLSNNRLFYTLMISALALFTALTGCDNAADSGDDHDEHAEPVGVVFVLNGTDVVTQQPNPNNTSEAEVTGRFSVDAGAETALITAYFIADDGDRFQPDEPEYSLSWEVADGTIAEVEQHAEDGKWSFHLHGATAGNTTVTFSLMHDGHSDFDTQALPIVVN